VLRKAISPRWLAKEESYQVSSKFLKKRQLFGKNRQRVASVNGRSTFTFPLLEEYQINKYTSQPSLNRK